MRSSSIKYGDNDGDLVEDSLYFLVIVVISTLSNLGGTSSRVRSSNFNPLEEYSWLSEMGFKQDIAREDIRGQEWKYAILQCVSAQDDVMRLRIITVNEYAEAEEVVARLRAGASFALLAMEKSTHPSKEMEGFLGFFKMEDLNEQFLAALKGIEEGEYTDIIEIVGE